MSTWSTEELARVARTDEVGISSRRPDGTLRPYVIIWAVATDAGVFVRSAYGAQNGWYRRAVASGTGSIRVGVEEIAVRFASPDASEHEAVDAAYLEEYAGYPSIVRGIVGPDWHGVTLRLERLDGSEDEKAAAGAGA